MLAVEGSLLQRVVGGLIGALFVAGLLSLLIYARRDPNRFKKLIASFLMNEVPHLHTARPCIRVLSAALGSHSAGARHHIDLQRDLGVCAPWIHDGYGAALTLYAI